MKSLRITSAGLVWLVIAATLAAIGSATVGAEFFAGQGTRAQLTEYQLKAAFLLNFTKFIDWPEPERAATDTPFTICVYGEDPFGSALDQIVQGESVNGRKLVVRRLGRSTPESCQVLFFSKSQPNISRVLSTLPVGVLTVGESEQFLADGGTISFVLENRRVRFDINQRNARNAGLRISSKLLNLAKTVQR